jgi:EAL domain-containing protein (putative c-di-GMP-specific phosphodiesterase class I)/GGDEF domain-containing protein
VTILARLDDVDLHSTLVQVAERMQAQLTFVDRSDQSALAREIARTRPTIIVIERTADLPLEAVRQLARRCGSALVVACHQIVEGEPAPCAAAEEWLLLPTSPRELQGRLTSAMQRVRVPAPGLDAAARLIRYEELLYDRLTGFPTLAVMIARARELLDTRGQVTILYIHFVWYEKIEEIYGWQRLDDVLETTAEAVRQFYEQEHPNRESLMMVSHVADDDFILFTEMAGEDGPGDERIRSVSRRLEQWLRRRIEDAHGEDLAALCGIYVGSAVAFRNPKIRTERLIYRGIREAAGAARGALEWERSSKIAELKSTLREGAVFIEYHPIIVTATQAIYGFEALARGTRRELRSPEVLFEVAEEANLLWELSRLLRRRAVEGIADRLKPDQFLFVNVDPHDFDDPSFRELDLQEFGIEGNRIVLEITERTAIKDYPRFQEYLAAFRARGFRFAVDDAGSGYAGLGSIANLAPDYIKLDISLISNIDTNFLKQNLVSTIVGFAESEGAKVIAEGVERREEFETIRQLGVHLTQGFLFHRPSAAGRTAA